MLAVLFDEVNVCLHQVLIVVMTDTENIDISREFTGFLCNGHVTLLGSIKLESNLVRLTENSG